VELTQAVEQSLEARPTLAAFYTGKLLVDLFLYEDEETYASGSTSLLANS
jgi:hypothetical protein